jgi:hypothetical protein
MWGTESAPLIWRPDSEQNKPLRASRTEREGRVAGPDHLQFKWRDIRARTRDHMTSLVNL